MRQGAQGGSDSDGWSGAVLASAGAILREQPVAGVVAGGDQVQGVDKMMTSCRDNGCTILLCSAPRTENLVAES